MQRYGSFGKWAKVLRTFARSCGDRGRNLRHIGDETAESCRKRSEKEITIFKHLSPVGMKAAGDSDIYNG